MFLIAALLLMEGPAPGEEGQPLAGYDARGGGFFLRSPDGDFLLKANVRLQARYTYFQKEAHAGDPVGRDESYFELERARFGFMGHFLDPRLVYKVEIDAETDASDKGGLVDTYIQYQAHRWIWLGVGQFKPFFLREEVTSDARLQRVDRSVSNEFFNIDRNVGVWAEGRPVPRLFYSLAVTNGIDTVNQPSGGGATTQLLDQVPAYVAKLDLTLLGEDLDKYSYEGSDVREIQSPLLVLGASFVEESYHESLGSVSGGAVSRGFVDAKGDVFSFGVDLAFKYRGFSLLGEYVGRWYDQNGPVTGSASIPRTDALYAQGFTLQGGHFVWRKPDLELTGRLSAVYGGEGPQDGRAVEAGPGLNWFFSGSHRGKLQMDVAWLDISRNLPSQTELLRQGPDRPFETTSAGFAEGERGVLMRIQVQLDF